MAKTISIDVDVAGILRARFEDWLAETGIRLTYDSPEWRRVYAEWIEFIFYGADEPQPEPEAEQLFNEDSESDIDWRAFYANTW